MRLDHAIKTVRELRRYRYRSCRVQHQQRLGPFVRHTMIKHCTRAEFDQAVEAEKNSCGKTVWVEIDKLRMSQFCLAYTRLLRQLRCHPPNKLPIIVSIPGGLFFLWDGNHRVTAAAMLGKRRVKCLMVGRSK